MEQITHQPTDDDFHQPYDEQITKAWSRVPWRYLQQNIYASTTHENGPTHLKGILYGVPTIANE